MSTNPHYECTAMFQPKPANECKAILQPLLNRIVSQWFISDDLNLWRLL
jgi:hypothetical protein